MRMRKMRNLEPRMEKCADYRILEPAQRKGNWRSLKPDCTEVWVEVGCGKGKFTAETAQANPDVLLIAVERCREAMVVAMEKAKAMGLTNVYYIDMDVANMEEIFGPGEIDRLFINFPDPWPRKKNAKRRLTHRSFLDKYCRVVRGGGVPLQNRQCSAVRILPGGVRCLRPGSEEPDPGSPRGRRGGHHDRVRGKVPRAGDPHQPLRSGLQAFRPAAGGEENRSGGDRNVKCRMHNAKLRFR